MAASLQFPVALTIAGSDSGGGAGIQADLKTFAAHFVHGTSCITCLTAQNPKAVTGIQAASPGIVRQQIEAVLSELKPRAAKTGMLFSGPIIQTVADLWKSKGRPPLIVDPVMVSTSGAKLLKDSAIRTLKQQLLPRATLVTPNLDEAEILSGRKLQSIEDLREAARAIVGEFGCAALVKGGHLRGSEEAIDIYFDGETELMLEAPFVKGVSTHGTGCTYSASIVANLALGHDLPQSVENAKSYISNAIAQSISVGKHQALNHFPRLVKGKKQNSCACSNCQ